VQNPENQEINLHLLDALIAPKAGIGWRVRSAPTKIKILYQFYQYTKRATFQNWENICPSKEDIAKHACVSRRHVTDFITSPDAELFIDIQRRERLPGTKKYQSNIYRLKPWLIEIFSFYEKTGMMKGFRNDFNAWKKTYHKRFWKWLIPQIQKGLSLKDVVEKKRLVNKLSTGLHVKGAADRTLKGAGIKYIHSPIKHSGSRSNTQHPIPAVQGLLDVGEVLRTRFFLNEGDINQLLTTVDLRTHKSACRIGLEWLKKGREVRTPVRLYQKCINLVKEARKCYR
jgi:hypothetical protein